MGRLPPSGPDSERPALEVSQPICIPGRCGRGPGRDPAARRCRSTGAFRRHALHHRVLARPHGLDHMGLFGRVLDPGAVLLGVKRKRGRADLHGRLGIRLERIADDDRHLVAHLVGRPRGNEHVGRVARPVGRDWSPRTKAWRSQSRPFCRRARPCRRPNRHTGRAASASPRLTGGCGRRRRRRRRGGFRRGGFRLGGFLRGRAWPARRQSGAADCWASAGAAKCRGNEQRKDKLHRRWIASGLAGTALVKAEIQTLQV